MLIGSVMGINCSTRIVIDIPQATIPQLIETLSGFEMALVVQIKGHGNAYRP